MIIYARLSSVLAMKYLLRENYDLCGWDNLECCLLHRDNMHVEIISPKEFKMLMLCNGKFDLGGIPNISFDVLQRFLDEKIIERIEEGADIGRKRPLYYKYNNRYIKCVQWSITGRCNYKCKHCYLDSPSCVSGDLEFERIRKIVTQMKACGIFHVKITGGEPLIRKDFWEIIDEFIRNEIVIDEIYTNGSLITDDFFLESMQRGICPAINISFDGVGTHDWMRGITGAETSANIAFEKAKKYGFIAKAEMCLHKGNLSTIRDTVNHLAQLNVCQLKIGPVVNTDLWKANCGDNSITPDEYYSACIDYIPYYFQDGMPLSISIGNVFQYDKEKSSIINLSEFEIEEHQCSIRYLCKSARNTAYIDPHGRFLPCMVAASLPAEYLEEFTGEIDDNLQELLCNSKYLSFIDMRVSDLFEANSKCRQCEYRYKCHGGCRVQAMLDQNGDKFGCDETMCDFYAKEINVRVQRKIDKVAEAGYVSNK